MNILVTGANGFIGQNLSQRLIELGHQVFGLSLKPSASSLRFTEYYQQDISRPFILSQRFDVVIHLAAYNITHVGDKDTDFYTAINVEGTRNLLKAVEAKHLIYLSTAKVYKNEGQPLKEDSPVAPQGIYEQSKLKAEEICRSFFKNESLSILRSVNVLGWGQAPKAVVPVFFQKAKNNQPLDIIYSPQTLMQFVYVQDLIDAFVAIIKGGFSSNGVFNIAYDERINLEQLAKKIITLTHSSSILNISQNSTELLFSPVICDKALKQLGWRAKTGISRILEIYEEGYERHL